MAGERINCGTHFALEYAGQISEVAPDTHPGTYPTMRLSHDALSEIVGAKDEPLLSMEPDKNVQIERFERDPMITGEGDFGGFTLERWRDKRKNRIRHFHLDLPFYPLQLADGNEFEHVRSKLEGATREYFDKRAGVKVCSSQGITLEYNSASRAYIFPNGALAIPGYESAEVQAKNDQWQGKDEEFHFKLNLTTQPYSIEKIVLNWCVKMGITEIQKEMVIGIFLGSKSVPRILNRLSDVVKKDKIEEEDLRDIVSAYMYIRGEQIVEDDLNPAN